MRILAVSGSLHATSENRALLEVARASAPSGVDVAVYDGLRDLPPFDPDLEARGVPPEVEKWRRALAESDAVLIASPEYGHSVPGALKNAVDWVIGTGELERKVVAITAAVPIAERGLRGLAALAGTLRAVSARIVEGDPIARGPGFGDGVRALVRRLVEEAERPEPDLHALLPGGEALEVLFERPGLPRFDLPAELATAYGGPIGFHRPRLFANFVTSLDGVVSLPEGGESGFIISQGSAADRLVMGLLRSCADAVIVGAGTFRRSPGHRWDAETIYPAAAGLFQEVRARLGLRPRPTFVLVSGSGALEKIGPALDDAWIVTTSAGEDRIRQSAPSRARILVLGSERVRFADVLSHLHAEGLRLVLTEGGPSLFAELIQEKILDELFVTSSPSLFGRYPNDHRKSLTEGLDLGGVPLSLDGVRRHRSHLFLRYSVPPGR